MIYIGMYETNIQFKSLHDMVEFIETQQPFVIHKDLNNRVIEGIFLEIQVEVAVKVYQAIIHYPTKQ